MRKVFISAVQLIIFFCILANSVISFSQNSQMNWSNWHFDGSFSSRDFYRKAVKSSSGITYIIADTEKDISNFDITTFALSDNGDVLWEKKYSKNGGTSLEQAVDLYVDIEDNVYVVGYNWAGTRPTIILIKYNKDGELIWERILKNTHYYSANGLTVDKNGCTYLIINETIILKFDKNGKLIKQLDSPIERKILKVVYTSDENLYLIGEIFSDNYAKELVISKIDTAGNMIWYNEYPQEIWREINEIIDINFDSNQNLYILSNIYTEGRRFNNYMDVMMQKIESDGTLCWVETYGGKYKNLDETCGFEIIGDTSLFLGGHSMNDTSLLDIFLLEYDSSGVLIDSLFYNSSFNESDYLFSFEIDSGRNKYLTTSSFVDDYQFYSSIIKFDKNNSLKWEQISPMSLSERIYPEDCLLNINEDKLFIFGNLKTTYNLEVPYDIGSDYWIMKLDTSGAIIDETVYSETGTTNVFDCFITKDEQNNSYVSAKVRKGPKYFSGYYFYNFDLILNKLDSLGNEVWCKKINNAPIYDQYYYGHFMVEDSNILLISSQYSNDTNYTAFYKFNKFGVLIDEIKHKNTRYAVRNVIADDSGTIYTYERLGSVDSSKIRKFNSNLNLIWEINVEPYGSNYTCLITLDNNNNLLFANGDGTLYRITDAGEMSYLGNFSWISDVKTDPTGNIFVCGYADKEETYEIQKLSSEGTVEWFFEENLSRPKCALMSNGDIAFVGANCFVGGCKPSIVFLLDSEGNLKDSILLDISIDNIKVDDDDNLIINARNHLLKLSSSLEIVSKLQYENDTLNISYNVRDFLIGKNNDIYTTGGAGNQTYLNTHVWYALLTTKFDNSNTKPYFINSESKFSLELTDSLYFDYNALDYESDPIKYSVIGMPEFLGIDSLSGVISGKVINHDPDDYKFNIVATDIHGASETERVNLRIGNKAPLIMNIPKDSVEVGTNYFFEPPAKDPEYDKMTFEISIDTLWFSCEVNHGYIRGTPELSDLGTYTIELTVTDEFGASSKSSYQLTVYSDNDPTDILLTNSIVYHGDLAGAIVGKLHVEDIDEGQTYTYSLTNGNGVNDIDNNKFTILNDSLIVDEDINYEIQNNYKIFIQVLDNLGGYYSKGFEINVIDSANNDPTDIILSNNVIKNGDKAGTLVGNIIAIDQDDNQLHMFDFITENGINDKDNNKFTITNDSLLTNEEANYSIQSKYNIYINVSDNRGGSYDKAFQIIVDVNNSVNFLNNNMVSIYPNPTSGAIEIELSDIQFQRFSIIDLDGKVIFQKSPVDQKENVDLSGFDDGLYIIILETNNESYKMKIIKE